MRCSNRLTFIFRPYICEGFYLVKANISFPIHRLTFLGVLKWSCNYCMTITLSSRGLNYVQHELDFGCSLLPFANSYQFMFGRWNERLKMIVTGWKKFLSVKSLLLNSRSVTRSRVGFRSISREIVYHVLVKLLKVFKVTYFLAKSYVTIYNMVKVELNCSTLIFLHFWELCQTFECVNPVCNVRMLKLAHFMETGKC